MMESVDDVPAAVANRAPTTAGYQGAPGAFGEMAVNEMWNGQTIAVPAPTFGEALADVIARRVQCAVIPVWNSTIGNVAAACAALEANASDVEWIGEIAIPVHHCLLALPGTSLADVRYVGSHAAALGQCARLFAMHPELVACEAFDTAGAAQQLAALHDRALERDVDAWFEHVPFETPSQLAVIASAAAGHRYGLDVLRENVQADRDNITRFVIVRALISRPSPDQW